MIKDEWWKYVGARIHSRCKKRWRWMYIMIDSFTETYKRRLASKMRLRSWRWNDSESNK